MDAERIVSQPGNLPRRRTATKWLCLGIGLVLTGLLLAGLLIPDSALAADFSRKALPPTLRYPFGTDWLGRNMLLRTLKGLSLSVYIGSAASGISAIIALLVGVAAAMGSRTQDAAIGWFIDLVMGIPHLVLLILISFACGRGLGGLLAAIALTHWTSLARLLRAEVLQLRGQPYIAASRKLGHTRRWVLVHHILPHMLPQFTVGLVLLFPHAVLHEAALSFLGFGLPPEQPAIGIILAESMRYITGGLWWPAVLPGLCLVLVVLLFDRLGNNLKQLLDPVRYHE